MQIDLLFVAAVMVCMLPSAEQQLLHGVPLLVSTTISHLQHTVDGDCPGWCLLPCQQIRASES